LLLAEQPQSYKVNSCEETLVNELWALRSRCDKTRAGAIAEKARLPLKWIDSVPSRNGEKGMDKLLAERGVLLLRNRTSPFIEQFGHPLGRCAYPKGCCGDIIDEAVESRNQDAAGMAGGVTSAFLILFDFTNRKGVE